MTQSTEAAQPRAIVVQDISCVGRCSLTVALPVLSAAGVNTAVVPTALLSTHTGEFTGYTHLDLSGQLLPIARHIETLGLHFDAFYSGYLASGAQVEMVLEMIDLLCDGDTHLFVDPAFGDHGRLYSLLDSGLPRDATALQAIGYKQLLAVAEGTATTEEAIAEVKLRSRQYAKRQLTWLRRNPDIFWVRWQRQPNFPEGLQKATEYLHSRGLC